MAISRPASQTKPDTSSDSVWQRFQNMPRELRLDESIKYFAKNPSLSDKDFYSSFYSYQAFYSDYTGIDDNTLRTAVSSGNLRALEWLFTPPWYSFRSEPKDKITELLMFAVRFEDLDTKTDSDITNQRTCFLYLLLKYKHYNPSGSDFIDELSMRAANKRNLHALKSIYQTVIENDLSASRFLHHVFESNSKKAIDFAINLAKKTFLSNDNIVIKLLQNTVIHLIKQNKKLGLSVYEAILNINEKFKFTSHQVNEFIPDWNLIHLMITQYKTGFTWKVVSSIVKTPNKEIMVDDIIKENIQFHPSNLTEKNLFEILPHPTLLKYLVEIQQAIVTNGLICQAIKTQAPLETLAFLLENFDLTAEFNKSHLLLQAAAANNDYELVRLLLSRGASYAKRECETIMPKNIRNFLLAHEGILKGPENSPLLIRHIKELSDAERNDLITLFQFNVEKACIARNMVTQAASTPDPSNHVLLNFFSTSTISAMPEEKEKERLDHCLP